MLTAMEHADVVAGSRSAAGAQVDRQQPLRRRLVGWPFIALTRMLLREPTKDVYCGFKLWRANAAEAVFSRQRLTGWVFDAEVLALARGLGFRVTEVGVAWADRRGSKLSITQVLLPAVRELLDARRNVRAQLTPRGQRPVSTSDPADGSSEAELVAEPGAGHHARDQVERPLQHLVVHVGEVAPQHADAHQLDAARGTAPRPGSRGRRRRQRARQRQHQHGEAGQAADGRAAARRRRWRC